MEDLNRVSPSFRSEAAFVESIQLQSTVIKLVGCTRNPASKTH